MPAGVSWSKYLKFFTASMVTMFAGAQCVHLLYQPLADMEVWVETEKQKLVQNPDQNLGQTEGMEGKSS